MAGEQRRRRRGNRQLSQTGRFPGTAPAQPHEPIAGIHGPLEQWSARVDVVIMLDESHASVTFGMMNGQPFETTVPTVLSGFEHLVQAGEHYEFVTVIMVTIPGKSKSVVLAARPGRHLTLVAPQDRDTGQSTGGDFDERSGSDDS